MHTGDEKVCLNVICEAQASASTCGMTAYLGPSTSEAYMAGQAKNKTSGGLHRPVQHCLLAEFGSRFDSQSSLPPPNSIQACASKESAPGSMAAAYHATQKLLQQPAAGNKAATTGIAVLAISLTLIREDIKQFTQCV